MNIVRVLDIYEGKIFDMTAKDSSDIVRGDFVIIKNEEGQEAMGRFIRSFTVSEKYATSPVLFLRKATPHDIQKIESLEGKSKSATVLFIEKTAQYGCPMKPVSVQYSFNNKNIHFTFTSPERVDFRDLLKDLVSTFKKKIFLEQIGPKDRAQVFGGYGKCGHEQCCSTFLSVLPSVTMEAVRQQHLLYKSSSKLLGGCGKLLCCLTYEIELYKELSAKFPSLGSIVSIDKEKAEIIGMDILNQTVRVQFEKTEKVDTVSITKIKIIKKKEEELLIPEEDEKIVDEVAPPHS